MSRNFNELETVLTQLIAEHRSLLVLLDEQLDAMQKLNLPAMHEVAHKQEAVRLRILSIENRRKQIIDQLAIEMRVKGPLTLKRIAELNPPRSPALLTARTELKSIIGEIRNRTNVGGRLAGAMLGHLNTVVRLVSGAVERAGLYTKHGMPRVSSRVGVMNAVG